MPVSDSSMFHFLWFCCCYLLTGIFAGMKSQHLVAVLKQLTSDLLALLATDRHTGTKIAWAPHVFLLSPQAFHRVDSRRPKCAQTKYDQRDT